MTTVNRMVTKLIIGLSSMVIFLTFLVRALWTQTSVRKVWAMQSMIEKYVEEQLTWGHAHEGSLNSDLQMQFVEDSIKMLE